MTLNDLSYKIIEDLRAQLKTTDSIDLREVHHKVHLTRAKLIKQKIEKYPMAPIEETLMQSIGSQKLELVDSSVVTGILSGRRMLRTINDIPAPIFNNLGEPMFAGLSGGDLLSPTIKMTTFEKSKFLGNNKFNASAIYAFYLDSKLYLTSKDTDFRVIKYITGRAVFQDPMAAGLLTDANYDETSDYPISYNMAIDLENIIAQEWFKLALQQIGDTTDNQTDDTIIAK